MSIRIISKSRKTKLLATLAVSAFVFVFVLQLIPFANASVETDFMTTLNAERASLGKAPLAINPSLTTAAYLHSKDMGDNNYFSHTSLDGRTFDQRIRNAGYTGYYSLGENIAYAYGSANAAMVYDMWKNSAGHYANMMGDFNEAGLGVYSIRGYTYYTLDLGKRSNPVPPPPPPTPTPDFLVSSPSTLSVQAGSSGTSTVTATSVNDFSGTVTFTASAPTGWTVSFNPSSLAVSAGASQTATISVTVPTGTSAGTYAVTLTGTSGSTSHSTTITVNVASPPPQKIDFSISASSPSINVKIGATATQTITVASLGGFNGPISFSVAFPVSWKATFNPLWVTLAKGSSDSVTITVTVPTTATANTYTIWVYGLANGNSLVHSTAITVYVQAPDNTLTVPSSPQNLQTTAGNAQIALSWIAPTDNGGSPVTGYKIYKRTGTEETLATTLGNVLSYIDTAVTNGQTYYYRVAAVNSVGESAKSTEAQAVPTVPIAGTLNVIVTTDKPSYNRGSTVVVTIKATDSDTGKTLPNTLLTVELFAPNGASQGSVNLKTDATGTAKAGFGSAGSVPTGTYAMHVTASQTGYPSTTTQATFALT